MAYRSWYTESTCPNPAASSFLKKPFPVSYFLSDRG